MFSPLPNGIKVTFVFELFNRPVTVTVHVTSPVAIDGTELTKAVNAATGVWTNGFQPAMSNSVRLVQIEALDVSIPDGEKKVYIAPPATVGARNEESMSANVATVVSLRTARTGRSRRGRIYVPGIAVGDVAGNDIIGAQQTRLATLASNLSLQYEIQGLQLVIASYFNNGVQRVTALATPVAGYLIPDVVKTQRRRLG